MKTFNAGLTYAYHVNLSEKSRLGGGITAAYVQRSVNTGNYQWANQYNGMEYDAGISPDESITTPSRSYLDLAGGVHWGYRKSERYMTGNDQLAMNAGVSMFHMTNPRYSFCGSGERLNSKVVMYFNAVIGISNTKNSVLPGYAMFLQGKSNEILMGALYRYQFQEDSKYTGNIKASAISFGGYYRNRDAFIAKVMYEFSQYSIGVSYDINVSGLKKASNGLGGVEISLRFTNAAPFLYKNKASI